MTRKECLEQAMGCVLRDRNSTYGKPEDCFDMIAGLWTAYLGEWITALDVSMMMALLKVARVKANPQHGDSFIDIAGYAACGAELAPVVKKKPGDEVGDPEFKPGDKVQVYYPSIEEWRDATYVSFCQMSRDCWRHEVEFASGGRRYVPREQIRPTQKAEGCEELVQKDLADECEGCLYKTYADSHAEEYDAPQTPEETCQRIVDNNPATYERPCKPTGEELAEMAGEARIMWETRYEDNENA